MAKEVWSLIGSLWCCRFAAQEQNGTVNRQQEMQTTADRSHSPITEASAPEGPRGVGLVVQEPHKQKAMERPLNVPVLGKCDSRPLPQPRSQQSSIAKGICSAAIRKSQQEAAAAIAAGCTCICE